MYNQQTLLIMNHGCNLIVSPFNSFQARIKEFGRLSMNSMEANDLIWDIQEAYHIIDDESVEKAGQ